MKKLKEKLEKRQENSAEKFEMSYTYRAIRAAEHLRTTAKKRRARREEGTRRQVRQKGRVH